MKTLRERLMQALTKRGERQISSRSYKHLTFTRKEGGYYFIGRSGALRHGNVSSNSIPVNQGLYQSLLSETYQ